MGLTVSEAAALAEAEGRAWRIGRQDDAAFVLTDDPVAGRVTFEIDDGTVTTQQQVDFGAQPFAVCSERLGWRACVVHDLQGYVLCRRPQLEAAGGLATCNRSGPLRLSVTAAVNMRASFSAWSGRSNCAWV
ncbi:MAG: hypothetical protein IH941_14745 [Acidobacteria bacterium]|nr:hypothetical protein [Acidobacteriota bacterium]